MRTVLASVLGLVSSAALAQAPSLTFPVTMEANDGLVIRQICDLATMVQPPALTLEGKSNMTNYCIGLVNRIGQAQVKAQTDATKTKSESPPPPVKPPGG